MSGEKQCPLRAGQSVMLCSGERCAWWDNDHMTRCCVLMTIAGALGKVASTVREVPRLFSGSEGELK